MIVVCSLRAASQQVEAHGAGRAVSILGPETPHPSFSTIGRNHHLRLTFNDIAAATPGLAAPQVQDAERLIAFIEAWDQSQPMLIHCWAGISRSTAAAYTALCLLRPREDEHDLAIELREASPSATPNRLIVSQVDRLLGRQGRMVEAIATIGRGADAFEGAPFRLSIK